MVDNHSIFQLDMVKGSANAWLLSTQPNIIQFRSRFMPNIPNFVFQY
ncbi:hypothetical protein VCRA2133E348_220048 [Vibrio crassostreae]|nr:hypothetical protein VCRA2133E348_220048 [Vibrio crassostreae]CAK3253458.1 hypothetical protein VCRA213O314_200048 [Vibrio crassostreae]